jgi:succinate-semialdehyde dehydrogenase/glutarate-semialdehyde dehydrogenase
MAETTRTSTSRSRSRTKAPQTLRSFDPRRGTVLDEIRAVSPGEVADIVAHARKVQPEWAAIPPAGRARMLAQVRHRIYELKDEIVRTVAAECGKPEFEALGHDVLPPLMALATYEQTAAKFLRPKRVSGLARPRIAKMMLGAQSRVEYRPFGVVGCITPWNYPITNCFLAFLPALAAGNAVVIKPSEVTPACGELIRAILDPLPAGVASVIQGGGDVGAALVDAPCDKISFVGSPPTGRKICEAAAKHLTPVVMELGGKDAAIVCDDADLDIASSGILWGSFFNAGQTCCSIERTYVVDSIADRFEDQLVSKLGKVRYATDDAEVGSLTFGKQLDIVSSQVKDALEKGAKLLAGGPEAGPKNKNGSLWYAPTILENVSEEMSVLRDETFGPVLSITRVRDEQEAIRRANEEGVNLTASVWTKSRDRGDAVASELKAGTVTVNFHGEAPAAAWAPWGGVGESGFGRLNGTEGLREFVIPVHVARPMLKQKRFFWYPYSDNVREMTEGVVQLLAAPSTRERLAGARRMMSNISKTMKEKL